VSNLNTDVTSSNDNQVEDDVNDSTEHAVDQVPQVDSEQEEMAERPEVASQESEDMTDILDEESEKREEKTVDIAKEQSTVDVNSNLNWYIVQTLSNYEKRVETRVQQIIDAEKYKGKLFRVLVPTQQTVELKNNKRLEKITKIFPGYVFIQMDIEDELAYELRQIPGIAKFIGIGNKPTPVVEDEILKVLRKVGDTSKEIDVDFEVGEVIKVVDGPFRGYTGTISEINSLKANIKAKISIFGRETPVELDFEQVEKTV
tara:strand:- start:1691 stop:2467 length:777 start_codon:yes stop_codon:yes gene_type:complete